MTNISLRLRITMLVGLVLTLLTIILTSFSILNVNHYFVEPQRKSDVTLMSTEVLSEYSISNEKLVDLSNISSQISITDVQNFFSVQSVILSVIIIFFGIGLTYLMMGRALKPLTDLSRTIQDINEHTLDKLILISNSKDEIGSISISFNKMIDRIKSMFNKQKYFAASAAHELKTPLATMKAAVQVLELDDFPSNEDYQESMLVVKQNVDRMVATVNDLFLLSFEEKTSINDIISIKCLFNQIAKELEDTLSKKKITCMLPEKDCLINGNFILIHSAFFNIFENAVKYNKYYGSITVTLRDLKNEKVLISIEDTGIGMTKEEVDSAFDPFFRSTYAINKKIDGNGLGLSVIQTIINRHAGQIALDSRLNEGTKITIILSK